MGSNPKGFAKKKKIVLIFNFYKMNKSHSLQVAVVVIHVALVLIDSLRIDACLEKKMEKIRFLQGPCRPIFLN